MMMVLLLWPSAARAEGLSRFGVGPCSGSSGAVRVDDVPLVFSTQVFPQLETGGVAASSAREQAEFLLSRVESALGEGAASRIVKWNFCVTSDEAATEVRGVLDQRYAGSERGAVSFVVGQLPRAGAHVALDVVAVDAGTGSARLDRREHESLQKLSLNPGNPPLCRVMPGSLVFVAGQAEAGNSIAEATRNTLRSLDATLQHLGLSFADVISVRSFVSPMDQAEAAVAEIQKIHRGPQSVVEWLAPGTIEIELLAASPGPALEPAERVEYITPPGMQASAVFSRVSRTHGPSLIFVSGLYGTSERSGGEEVPQIFANLEQLLKPAGGNLRNLAKATYYVSTDDSSARLNELRPKYYDPQRPPAASKAVVRGTGVPGKTVTLDMIAVPAPRE
ncbi:MAG TPA: translation initiation inhibitor [Planctomycetaceae bacterium]|nr:translation initiation inhibitor [Planctomycetaceae bacterium]